MPNQTTLLSHSILGLGSRLENLETSISDIQSSLRRLDSESSTDTYTLAKSSRTYPTPEDFTPSPQATIPRFKRPVGHFLTYHNTNMSERYFGPTSLESLMHDMNNLIIEPLSDTGSENQTVRECALLAHQKIELLLSREEELTKDGSAPTAPPFSVLEAMIEPYFATINPYFPIWTKEHFVRLATVSHHSEYRDQDRAYIICSNNLILMTLAANSLRSRPGKQVQSKHTRKTSSIDFDLTKSFLTNAKRAIENIELLLSPRLINVQALLSLCVVAQEHLSSGLFGMIFNLAAQCAKSIGLHQWEYSRGQISDEDTQEGQNVSYCLYILDKAVCWTSGTSPSIPISDVQIYSALKSPDDEAATYLVAKAKLAEIEETIYLEIYSNQAKAKTEEQVRRIVSKIFRRLQGWLADSGIDTEDVENGVTQISTLKIELSIAFFSMQLLLIWPFKEHPDAMFQRIEVAKRCMRLLLRLWRSPLELGHYVTFPRLTASYPAFYLYEICAHLISGLGEESDVNLLQSFIGMLQIITDSREKNSYNRRLYELSIILIEVIAAIRTQGKRQKTQASPEARPTKHTSSRRSISFNSPRINAISRNNDGNNVRYHNDNHISPQTQEDHQSIRSLMFPDLNDPLALNTSTDSEDAGFKEYSADELATMMGRYEKGPFENFDFLSYSET